LAGGVAQLKVGGATETQMKERKALYEDSLHATRAALAEGIVPGGGVALLHARKGWTSSNSKATNRWASPYSAKPSKMPCRLIAENAGEDGTVVVSNISKQKDKNYGFRCQQGRISRPAQGGHHRPGEVTRSALQNGAVGGVPLMTTESLIADIPEPKKDDHHDHHHGGAWVGMGGMGGGMGAWRYGNDVNRTEPDA